jgi:hypothetical protein
MAEQDHDPALNQLGRQLRDLSPQACPLDRDALMFRAGRSSARAHWLWPVLAALATCLAVTFGAALLVQPPPTRIDEAHTYYPPRIPPQVNFPRSIISSSDPDGPSEPPGDAVAAPPRDDLWATPDTGYFHTQNSLLRWGLDGVPLPPAEAAPRPAEKPAMLIRSF